MSNYGAIDGLVAHEKQAIAKIIGMQSKVHDGNSYINLKDNYFQRLEKNMVSQTDVSPNSRNNKYSLDNLLSAKFDEKKVIPSTVYNSGTDLYHSPRPVYGISKPSYKLPKLY